MSVVQDTTKDLRTPDARPAPEVRALDYTGSERLTMNMGPQHPSAHGVFRAILTLEGETVVGVDSVIGYLHRCHESSPRR
jgi:NADH:ubiquinone oxidoreductase subunit D